MSPSKKKKKERIFIKFLQPGFNVEFFFLFLPVEFLSAWTMASSLLYSSHLNSGNSILLYILCASPLSIFDFTRRTSSPTPWFLPLLPDEESSTTSCRVLYCPALTMAPISLARHWILCILFLLCAFRQNHYSIFLWQTKRKGSPFSFSNRAYPPEK